VSIEKERINQVFQSSLRGGDRKSSGKSYGQTYNSESQVFYHLFFFFFSKKQTYLNNLKR